MSIKNAVYPKNTVIVEVNEMSAMLNNTITSMYHSSIESVVLFNKYTLEYTIVGIPKKVSFTSIRETTPDTILVEDI